MSRGREFMRICIFLAFFCYSKVDASDYSLGMHAVGDA